MQRLETSYKDIELRSISESFNLFLRQTEQFVQREKNLLNMASHELRTPIAVTLGGLDILEKRGNFSDKDRVTLQRMRQACLVMQTNVDVLLNLARYDASQHVLTQHPLAEILEQVRHDLEEALPEVKERLALALFHQPMVTTQFNMAYMVARNLIQHAIQHSSGSVKVRVYKR